MYCNLTRTQGLPMAIRVSLQQTKAKTCPHYSKVASFTDVSSVFTSGKNQKCLLVTSSLRSMEIGMLVKPASVRAFSSFDSQRFGKRSSSSSSRGRSGLGAKAYRDKRSVVNGHGDSIWAKSDEKPVGEERDNRSSSSWERRDVSSSSRRRDDSVSSDRRSKYKGQGETRNRDSFRGRARGREGEDVDSKKATSGNSIWVANDDKPDSRNDSGSRSTNRTQSNSFRARGRGREEEDESKKASGNSIWVANSDKPAKEQDNRTSWDKRDGRNDSVSRRNQNSFRARGDDRDNDVEEETVDYAYEDFEEGETEGNEEEPSGNRWSEIKTRFDRYDVRGDQGRDNAAYRNWNRQESWGKRTWQEATESSVPRMVGEVVYGVSPVLAALSVGRREFYALYVQEGLDLSSNNKKKKDKKGFEKVLKISEQLGLNIKETSKHDLNMVSDNRPHQGLVLDASRLELVKVKELDRVSSEEEEKSSSLWVALDEVTDPQNLGAIIRSAYFFGATGVVVCAKNSAPLSAVVSKASAGSLEVMELRYCKNMMQFLESSADNGWRIVGGSVSQKAVALKEVLPGRPTILVMGNEGTGLRPLVERSCTDLVRISGNVSKDVPVTESDDAEFEGLRSFVAVESLNVSVAAGLFLHHLIGDKASV